ncbi:isochorismatase family protein [Aristophania vespae]|uniref:nicotinamidase n=1 Tax=Aristophania vespae TaxID=2697033 RepID=A0A6P1NE64_9PROT|nr:isochorismatase family protein [Aristophania vespae]QHI95758.1 isochorismatase family protein [Aristophania vespae]
MPISHIGCDDALLIIDLQNDFLPGGALAVKNGHELAPLINDIIKRGFSTVIASRDWHPPHHQSFSTQGGKWAQHCVAGTQGAEFDPHLNLTKITHIIHKGTDPKCESYSAFEDENGRPTGLEALLKARSIKRVFLCGLALDYCVKATALDAIKAKFDTVLLHDATRSIHKPELTLNDLQKKGVKII